MVVAVAAAHGPGIAHDVAGGRVAVPATYQTSTEVFGADFTATGPLGARVEFAHIDSLDVPAAQEIAQGLVNGAVSLPSEFSLRLSSVTMLDLPAGQAVQVIATIDGDDGRVVMLPTPGRLWLASFASDGGSGSSFDFDEMLRSWRLPVSSQIS
jgi:hypothetical protein